MGKELHTPTPWHTQRGSIVGNGKQVAIVGYEGQVLRILIKRMERRK